MDVLLAKAVQLDFLSFPHPFLFSFNFVSEATIL